MRTPSRCTILIQLPVAFCGGSNAKALPVPGHITDYIRRVCALPGVKAWLGVHTIGKKVVEEAAEAWMAAEHEGRERTAEEISQLLYQAQVLMIATGLELKDVYRHL